MSQIESLPRLIGVTRYYEDSMTSRHFALLLLGLIALANGSVMLFAPQAWYLSVPGVPHTGPLNMHFVRDIGCAYLVSGMSFIWLWRVGQRAWPAAVNGCAFLALHAVVHLGEAAMGMTDLPHFLIDIPGVFLLPLAAICLLGKQHPVSTNAIEENNDVTMVR